MLVQMEPLPPLTAEKMEFHRQQRQKEHGWKKPQVVLVEGDPVPDGVDPMTVRFIPRRHPFALNQVRFFLHHVSLLLPCCIACLVSFILTDHACTVSFALPSSPCSSLPPSRILATSLRFNLHPPSVSFILVDSSLPSPYVALSFSLRALLLLTLSLQDESDEILSEDVARRRLKQRRGRPEKEQERSRRQLQQLRQEVEGRERIAEESGAGRENVGGGSMGLLATQRSSQGYTFSLGSGSVSWRSTRSSSVLSSSCEAEIYAGAMAAQELRWLTYLLTDLGEQPRSPPVLYVDNKAMLALCREHRLEHRTKHIALRYFLACELQQRGQLRLAYVASEANTADIFTKALAPGDHQRFCTLLDCVVFLLVPNILLVHSFLFLHKRVLRYLCSTSGMGLMLGGRARVVLTGHVDASWVDDLAILRSSQGYTFSLGSGSVSWRSTHSSSVLNSTCEAEVYTWAMAAQELRWITYLLTDLGEAPRSLPVLYVDNKAMLSLCQEHRLEHRTKHIAPRYFLARELQQRGQLRLEFQNPAADTSSVPYRLQYSYMEKPTPISQKATTHILRHQSSTGTPLPHV
ncbi:unnamed protein product [Closterium sp. NIES-54]